MATAPEAFFMVQTACTGSPGGSPPQMAGRLLSPSAARRRITLLIAMKGMSMATGQPSTQGELGQSRQRRASWSAASAESPELTSEKSALRTEAGRVGIFWRSIFTRSLAGMDLRRSLRQSWSKSAFSLALTSGGSSFFSSAIAPHATLAG